MKTIKKAEIKLRVTESQKDRLKQLAERNDMSLSSYILHQSLYKGQGLSDILPEKIEICNFLNEIYHMVNKYRDERLIKEITELYKNYTSPKGEEG